MLDSSTQRQTQVESNVLWYSPWPERHTFLIWKLLSYYWVFVGHTNISLSSGRERFFAILLSSRYRQRRFLLNRGGCFWSSDGQFRLLLNCCWCFWSSVLLLSFINDSKYCLELSLWIQTMSTNEHREQGIIEHKGILFLSCFKVWLLIHIILVKKKVSFPGPLFHCI